MLLFSVKNVSADEIDTLSVISSKAILQFDRIENPWGLTEYYEYELTDEELSKKYQHISIQGSQLYVFYYDKQFTLDLKTNNYTSENQALSVNKYNYDSTTKKFVFSSKTNWNGSSFNEKNVIWSSDPFIEINDFFNVDNLYNSVVDKIKLNSEIKDNLDYLISELKEKISDTFVIAYSESWGISVFFTKNTNEIWFDKNNWKSKEFICKSNFPFQKIEELTKEQINEFINNLRKTIDENGFLGNGSYGSTSIANNFVMVYYSKNENIEIKNNIYAKNFTWNDKEYKDMLPVLYESPSLSSYIFDEMLNIRNNNVPKKLIFNFKKSSAETFNVVYEYGVHHAYINSPYLVMNNSEDSVNNKIYELNNYCSSGEDCYGQYKGFLNIANSFSAEDTFSLIVDIPDPSIIPETRNEIKIYFEFDIPFTYEYVYENNMTDLNFTNKYGVAFFPKMKKVCTDVDISEIYSPFYLTLDDSDFRFTAPFQAARYNYDTKSFDVVDEPLVVVPIQEKTWKYDYKFKSNQLNDILIIRNPKVKENTFANIKYDSNLFDYQILETENDRIKYINPNTCEEIEGSLPPSLNEKNIFDSSLEFIDRIAEYIKSFFELVSYFFNKLPEIAKTAIISLLIIYIICSIILMARK